MEVRKVPVSMINPAPYNPRKDLRPGDPDYDRLTRSIQEFGFVEPLVWNKRTGNLVGGHQRFKILVDEFGATEVEVSVVDLDETREKALNIALNKIQGEWDRPKLKDLLEELDTGEIDIEITGFSEEEIEKLMTSVMPLDDLEPGAPESSTEDDAGFMVVSFRMSREEYEAKLNLINQAAELLGVVPHIQEVE